MSKVMAEALLSKATDLLADESVNLAEWRADRYYCDKDSLEALAEREYALKIKATFLNTLYDLLDEMEND